MSRHLERARLLFNQSRFELAEREVRQALAHDPDEPEANGLLALCLLHREQWDAATEAARRGVHLAPDSAWSHYVLSCVFSGRGRTDEAQRSIEEAIRLDPFDADYFAHLAELHLGRARWSDALAAAGQGLEIEADHIDCTNARAVALVKLGRRSEAGRTIDAALARDPEDATTHANMGWTLLEQRRPEQAMEHFREALRLEPDLEWARLGIVEAMKARHAVYRWMLGFFLWMSRFSGRTQWMLIIGFLVGKEILAQAARSIPLLAPLYWPIVIGYLTFAILTWIASPLFNLVLRLDRFGRMALSREETLASNLLAACLATACLIAAVPTAWSLAAGRPINVDYPLTGLLFLGLSLPVTNIFRCDEGWPRDWQTAIAILLTLPCVLTAVATGLDWRLQPLFFLGAAAGLILSTWVGTFLAMATVER